MLYTNLCERVCEIETVFFGTKPIRRNRFHHHADTQERVRAASAIESIHRGIFAQQQQHDRESDAAHAA